MRRCPGLTRNLCGNFVEFPFAENYIPGWSKICQIRHEPSEVLMRKEEKVEEA